jgi:periplasmic divalent cation tolerance protein
MTDLVLILTTMPDDDRADTVARTLVDEQLAACVNVHGPMVSTYRWKGRVEREAERQLVIKTTRDRLSDLEARLRALHPYELPEFVVIAANGSEAYVNWMAEATSGARSWEQLCQALEAGLDRPVVDDTNLKGAFALDVHAEAASTLEFLGAVRDRLGLVVTPARRDVLMLVARQRWPARLPLTPEIASANP